MLKTILKLGAELSKKDQKIVNGGKRSGGRCCNPTYDCCDPASYPSDCLAYGDPYAFPVPYCI